MIHISYRARVIDDAYSCTKRFMYDSRLKLSQGSKCYAPKNRTECCVSYETILIYFLIVFVEKKIFLTNFLFHLSFHLSYLRSRKNLFID